MLTLDIYFTSFSSAFAVDFEQVNACWQYRRPIIYVSVSIIIIR